MKYSVTTLVLGFFAALSAAAPTPAGDDVDHSQIYIKSAGYAGSGCPAGSVYVSPSDDKQSISLAFDHYVASIGPGITIDKNRRNCLININLHYPEGYQYALYQTDYTGFANLDPGVTATQQADYWFNGPRGTFQTTWKGQYTDTFTLHDVITVESYVWSPCSGATATLNINTQVYLTLNHERGSSPNPSGSITTDSIQNKVIQSYGVSWRKCH